MSLQKESDADEGEQCAYDTTQGYRKCEEKDRYGNITESYNT